MSFMANLWKDTCKDNDEAGLGLQRSTSSLQTKHICSTITVYGVCVCVCLNDQIKSILLANHFSLAWYIVTLTLGSI